MEEAVKVSVPLDLEGADNIRDLGGYPANKKTTKYNMFLRADCPHKLTESDLCKLYDYGVRCVIDLRTQWEIDMNPNMLKDCKDMEYINVPLRDGVQSDNFGEKFPESMGAMYMGLLDNSGGAFKTIFEKIAQYPHNCVMFNCRAGKDRTGTLAMLLLKLAKVADETVIADYSATQKYMINLFDEQKEELRQAVGDFPDYIFMSKPEDMQTALTYLNDKYKGVKNYLKLIGVDDRILNILENKLI